MVKVQESIDYKQQIKARLQSDPHAPWYHFIAPEGVCMPFDPNGALFWNGRYHLFYIFQDHSLPHGGHCWGHASSADLLHWEFHPTALAPTPGDPDVGIFSGGAFINREGVPTIIYHGFGCGTCIATAEDDDLIRWRKSPHNPVIPEPREGDAGWGVYNVFDPHAWLEGDTYYAILGGKVKPHDLHDTAYLFTSSDLIHWTYVRPFYNPHPHWTGEEEDCACPDFFQLGNRYVLSCISHPRGSRYYLGRYQDGTFVAEEHHRVNWPGGSCFAPESLLDDKGRRISWAWVFDQRKHAGNPPIELGVMTMPRVLSLDDSGQLAINPPVEFEALRHNQRRIEQLTLEMNQEIRLDTVKGDVMELMLQAELSDGAAVELTVRMADDGSEATKIIVDPTASTIAIDSSRSEAACEVSRRYPNVGPEDASVRNVDVQVAPLVLNRGELLQMRVFLDKSILEVYANGRQCMTGRIYPQPTSVGVVLGSRYSEVNIRSLDVWDLAATNGR